MIDDRRILSRPMGVEWAGWRSDTLRLQQGGWRIAVEFEPYRREYRLAMKHESMRLQAVTSEMVIEDFGRHTSLYREAADMPIFRVCAVAPSIQSAVVHGFNFNRFAEIDATPTFVEQRIQRLEDCNVFSVLGKTEQVLIDKADMTVVDHLEAIKQLQSEKQRELRQRILTAPQEAPARQRPRLQLVAQLVHYEEAA